MTNKQRELIEDMNEWCHKQCDLDVSKEIAQEYIEENIDEYRLRTAGEFVITNGYF